MDAKVAPAVIDFFDEIIETFDQATIIHQDRVEGYRKPLIFQQMEGMPLLT